MATRPLRFLAAFCVVALTAPGAAFADPAGDRQIVHVLNRVAFGPTQADFEHVKEIGIDRYIDEQLHPETIAEPPALTERLTALDTLKLDPAQLFAEYGPVLPAMNGGVKPTPEEAEGAPPAGAGHRAAGAGRAGMARALQPAPAAGGDGRFLVQPFQRLRRQGARPSVGRAYEADAIRPYALGHFRDLLLATAHRRRCCSISTTQLNTAPGSPGARGNETGINENYAREIMELHTLGVDGGYTPE